jgi:hypothetical protein
LVYEEVLGSIGRSMEENAEKPLDAKTDRPIIRLSRVEVL